MRATVFLAAGGLLLTSTAAATHAAAKPRISCHLITDPANDTHLGTPQAAAPTDEPGLDIVGADVAVDSRWVTAAVNVRSLAGLNDSIIPGPFRWSLRFTAGLSTYIMHARTGQGGAFGEALRVYVLDDSTESWMESGPIVPASVHFDQQRRQVRITVARHALDGNGGVALGERLTALHAYSWHEHTAYSEYFSQPGGEYDMADAANSRASYVAGTPSCVKPGS